MRRQERTPIDSPRLCMCVCVCVCVFVCVCISGRGCGIYICTLWDTIPEYPVTRATGVFPLLIGTEVNSQDEYGHCIICVCVCVCVCERERERERETKAIILNKPGFPLKLHPPPPINISEIDSTVLKLKAQKPRHLVSPTFTAARLITHALVNILMTESDKDKAAALLWTLVSFHALENT